MSGLLKIAMRVVLPVSTIVILMLFLGGAFRKGRIDGLERVQAESREKQSEYSTYTVQATSIPAVSEAAGTIQPEFKTTVSARSTANIVEIAVQAGQEVRPGDLLVKLDDRDLRTRLVQARESLRRAEAVQDLAQSEYDRDKGLFEKSVIPRSEFDQTDARLRTAAADVDRLKEAIREAEVALSYAEIRCPYPAVIIDKLAEVGDVAAPGRPLLTMYEQGRLWAEAAVREEDMPLLHLRGRYAVRIDAQNRRFAAELKQIVPSADPASRTVLARFSLPRDSGLFPGLFARVLLPRAPEKSILVPAAALSRSGQLELVEVVENGRLSRRTVQTGRRLGDKVEVLSGLVAGEVVALRNSAGGPR